MTLEQELEGLRGRLLNPESPPVPDSPSLAEMNALAAEIADLRDQEKAASEAKKIISDQLEAKENRIVELLMENGANSYKAPSGTLSLSFRLSARLPVGPAKALFLEHLRKEGRFDEMASVSSPTYCAYVKEQYELAREQGKEEPQIPGVTEVKTSPTLSFRRTR